MTKPYKTHLLERLQTLEDRVGYLRAAFEDGDSATINRAVQDVCESVNFRATTPTADDEQRAREIYESLPDCDFCGALCPDHASTLLDAINAALTRSRSALISQIEAKRDEWRDNEMLSSLASDIKVAAAGEILALLRDGGKG